jgi:hypothetical protein
MWNASIQQFAYDPNHSVYKYVIWDPDMWWMVLDTEVTTFAREYLMKYEFQYPRIGGVDPNQDIEDAIMEDIQAELDKNTDGITFEVGWAGFMASDQPEHWGYPRFLYYGPDGPDRGANCTYCGEDEDDGPWPDCDPDRFNVDGPAERLLKKGVDRIIMVSWLMAGIRYDKGFHVVEMTKKVVDEWNEEHGTSIPVIWVNDYSNLMERSFPTEPEGWTRSEGLPTKDSHVLLSGGPNPLAEDPEITELHVDGIEAAMSSEVLDSDTGVILMNHGLHDNCETFDPKINDTLIVNKEIKSQLLRRHPDMDPDNIVGAWGGIEALNPENGLVEHSRELRGERIGYAYLYQSDKELPGDEWGYRYWDAFKYLKDRGVKHIVIGVPHTPTDSVLNLVDIPNQLGKEIGIKTWAKWGTGDYENYPDEGHPFADYWGVWADTDCGGVPCCFEMGGCGEGRPYPPERQTPMDEEMLSFDPCLVYDLSDYGNLGYDPALGLPDPNGPVQDQYAGTWAMWEAPNDDPRVGKLLAKYVLNAAVNPMVYITNGEVEGVEPGESVTFEAHVVTGTPEYTYKWSVRKRGTLRSWWMPVGRGSSTWKWTPGANDAGTYNIRCKVRDARGGTGEVVWRDFEVSS